MSKYSEDQAVEQPVIVLFSSSDIFYYNSSSLTMIV